jgi:hypothetical protein
VATAKKDDAPTQVEAPADPVFEKPKATLAAEEKAAERAEEVAEQQKEAYLKNHTNVPGEAVVTIYATPDGDKDPDSITFAVDGSSVSVVATAKEMTFNRQDSAQIARLGAVIGGGL